MNTLAENKPVRKTARVTECLRQLAEEAGPDAKLPTYLELLDTLSVSRTTLNAALDELEGQRVIYRRHGVGIFTAAQRQSPTVALVCNPLYYRGKNHSPFWDVLLAGARERAALGDYSCEVHFCVRREPEALPFSDNLLHTLRSGHVQAVLGVGMNRAVSSWLKDNGIPYVSFGGPGDWYVGVDRSSVIQEGVRVLAEQDCKDLALVSPIIPHRQYSPDEAEWEIKTEIFRMALEQHRLPFAPHRLALSWDLVAGRSQMTTLSHQEQGHRAVHQLFADAARRPDGVLFTDDVAALGGLAALRELRLRPGLDVRVATHANRGTPLLAQYEDVITRLEVDSDALIDTLFSAVAQLAAGEKPAGFQSNPRTGEMQSIFKVRVCQPSESLPKGNLLSN
jgi:DNA-binding LacI/PurR family transcriptional regulator